jgi:hypothetical protein
MLVERNPASLFVMAEQHSPQMLEVCYANITSSPAKNRSDQSELGFEVVKLHLRASL